MTTAQKYIAGIVAAALLALGGGFALFSSYQALGASVNAYQSGIWQFGNGLYAGLSQQLSIDSNGALTQTATTTEASLGCKTFSGSFADATTTLFALQNPFGATSTVVFTTAQVTGVSTSTMSVEIGTTTANTIAPSALDKVSGSLATLTVATSTFVYITGGLGAAGIPVGGNSSGGTASMIQLAPSEVLAIYATSSNANGDNGGMIGRNNTLDGTYNVRICR